MVCTVIMSPACQTEVVSETDGAVIILARSEINVDVRQ